MIIPKGAMVNRSNPGSDDSGSICQGCSFTSLANEIWWLRSTFSGKYHYQSPLRHDILVQNHTDLSTFWKIMLPSGQLHHYIPLYPWYLPSKEVVLFTYQGKIIENTGQFAIFQLLFGQPGPEILLPHSQFFVGQGNQVYGVVKCCWGECLMFFNDKKATLVQVMALIFCTDGIWHRNQANLRSACQSPFEELH